MPHWLTVAVQHESLMSAFRDHPSAPRPDPAAAAPDAEIAALIKKTRNSFAVVVEV